MIVRGGKAFLALNFFISKHFADAFGFKLEYTPATGVLAAQRAVNITSINYFSHQDKTRIVVYMEEPLEWQASQKENNLFKITIFGGVVGREEKLSVGDGAVRGVDLLQENKTARVVISPDDNFGKASVFKLSDPDRLVIDVSKLDVPVRQTISGGVMGADGSIPVIAPSGGGFELGAASAAVAASSAAGVNIPDKLEVGAGRKKIVIDAGHGGKDPGGRKLFGLREKELNLLVSKELYKLLKAEDIFDVALTRSTDEFIPLADRSVIANNFKADIFISIHANASRDRRERGFEIYFMSEKASDPWAAEVADFENSVIGLGRRRAGRPGGDAAAFHGQERISERGQPAGGPGDGGDGEAHALRQPRGETGRFLRAARHLCPRDPGGNGLHDQFLRSEAHER